jgi:hypothetical protein
VEERSVISRVLIKKQRGRRWLTFVAAVGLLVTSMGIAGSALAVHDLGVFQLDGNASTTNNPPPTALEDWDLICKANQPPKSLTSSGECVFAPGYVIPGGTTKASPSSFEKDPSESATDDILKGGTKDDNDMTSWSWTSAKPSPPKNDLTDGMAAEYTCKGSQPNSVSVCSGTANDQLLYFGADRFSNSGSANIAFWFFQKKVVQKGNQADGTCTISSGCPFVDQAGNPVTHTVGNVSLGGSTPGDILIISAFGPKAQIFVYEWVGAGNATPDYLGTNSCFTTVCTLQPLFIGGSTSDCPEVTGDNACALANDISTPSPWVLPQKTGGANQFAPTDFFEGGLNLTKLGVGGACFSSFLINTRASAAGNAELHDKILGQFARCAPNLTTQASTNGEVTPGTPVTDTATITVTGATTPADATGTITFYLCPVATRTTCTTQIGTPVTLAGGGSSTDGISTALSLSVNDSGQTGARGSLLPGKYCFRAKATLTNYDNPDEFTNDTTECFTVKDTSTITTVQDWLPNDTATVLKSGGGAASGTVTFTLYESADCSGTAKTTFADRPVGANGKATTGNTTFIVPATLGATISWRATFTSSDPNVTGSTSHCETSTVTINNDTGS